MSRILEDISSWPMKKREKMIIDLYEERMGRRIDLEKPRLFTEMLQWMKLYYHDPMMKKIVDKVSFKTYIKDQLGEGYTAKLYSVWNSPDEVNLSSVRTPCVIKSNCMADGRDLYIIKDINDLMNYEKENEIKEKWFDRRLLLTNSFANWYYGVIPRVLIEEYIKELGDGSAKEFKIYCFNGEPKCIGVPQYRFENGVKKELIKYSLYDSKWNYLYVQHGNWPTTDGIKKPKQIDCMIEISKKLSRQFPFVRVDFFHGDTFLYISEMSFSVTAGFAKFEPVEFEEKMGRWMDITKTAKKEFIIKE